MEFPSFAIRICVPLHLQNVTFPVPIRIFVLCIPTSVSLEAVSSFPRSSNLKIEKSVSPSSSEGLGYLINNSCTFISRFDIRIIIGRRTMCLHFVTRITCILFAIIIMLNDFKQTRAQKNSWMIQFNTAVQQAIHERLFVIGVSFFVYLKSKNIHQSGIAV